MRAILDEATIRRLVREGITRKMLSEVAPGVMPTSIPKVPTFDPGDLFGGLFGGDEKKSGGSGATLGNIKKSTSVSLYGKRPAEGVYDAIARVALGDENAKSDIDDETGEEIIGERVGTAIVEMLTNPSNSAKSDFKPSAWDKVMVEWAANASSIPELPSLGTDGKPDGKSLKFPPDENGLLRYLIAVRAIEFGYAVLREQYESTMGLIAELNPTREALDDIFDMPVLSLYMTNQNLRDAVGEILNFINAEDKSPDLEKTRMLLAYFAAENTSGSEGLGNVLTGVGIAAAVVAVAVGLYLSGGLLAGAFGGGVGGATGVAGAAAAAESIAGTTGLVAVLGSASGSSVLPTLLAGVSLIAAQGVIATGAAGITGIVIGGLSAQWCGNEMPAFSDEYMDFMAAQAKREGISELREEFTSVYSLGDEVTSDIIKFASDALQKIESGRGENIRAEVIQLLKKAQNV